MNCEEDVQTVAADFAEQYTTEEINAILAKSPTDIRAYLKEVVAESLTYAISILPGRPSRPKKPTV